MTEPTNSGVRPGLRVLVTAGAAGIGRVIAEAFVAQHARVYVCDISPEAVEKCRAEQPSIIAEQADVADEAAIDRLFDDVQKRLGGLDVLVNNAGIAGPTSEVEKIDPREWRRTIDVNLNSHFYCTRRAVPMLKQSEEGAIVNISSVAGPIGLCLPAALCRHQMGNRRHDARASPRSLDHPGSESMPSCRALSRDHGSSGSLGDRAKAVGVTYAEMEKQYLEKVSLRRMVSAEDVAQMALFLCSAAGRNISGQPISVCGNVETL